MSPLSLSISIAVAAISWHVAHASAISVGGGGGATTPHAGFVGALAGQLSAGVALEELNKLDGHFVGGEEVSFEGALEEHGQHESLGELGEHLSEHDFPHDFDGETKHGEDGAEYAEAASEHLQHYAHDFDSHGAVEEAGDFEEKNDVHFGGEGEIGHGGHDLGGGGHDDDDFHSKPVPGIDHGKGAFSYSTTYEFKDKPQHDEWKLR